MLAPAIPPRIPSPPTASRLDNVSGAFCALLADLALGDPAWLDRAVGHPARWLGGAVGDADRTLNRDTMPPRRRRINGVLALALSAGPPVMLASGVQRALRRSVPRRLAVPLLGILSGTLLAQRSLAAHVRDVGIALARDGLPGGRDAVSRIVGRDTAALDEAAILRAAIESLAENFADGVTAPLCWGVAFGLPGMVFYKAINTADSMIGHRSPRHAAFGWAAARLDDLVNLPASRLAALLLTLAAPPRSWRRIWRGVLRDAPRHRSPNAGWPEAAMAGALDLRLAGPRSYGGRPTADPPMGDGRGRADPDDLRRALVLYRRACILQAVILGGGLAAARCFREPGP